MKGYIQLEVTPREGCEFRNLSELSTQLIFTLGVNVNLTIQRLHLSDIREDERDNIVGKLKNLFEDTVTIQELP